MTNRQNSQLIDPDPFTVASLAMSAISVVFGAVQAYKAVWPNPAPAAKPHLRPHELEQLSHLEGHVETFESTMNKLKRSIERNSPDSDDQFYNAPLRIGVTNLMLPAHGLNDLTSHYAQANLQIAAIFRWLTTIQINSPDLAYRLGERLNEPLSGVTSRVNDALKTGAPTRVVLEELRSTLDALARAIEAEIGQQGN